MRFCIEQIVRYIRRDSPPNALEFARRLLAKAATLRESPGIGRVIPEQEDPAHREILFGSYRIMYHLSDQRVLLTRIIHGARDVERLARKPWDDCPNPASSAAATRRTPQ